MQVLFHSSKVNKPLFFSKPVEVPVTALVLKGKKYIVAYVNIGNEECMDEASTFLHNEKDVLLKALQRCGIKGDSAQNIINSLKPLTLS